MRTMGLFDDILDRSNLAHTSLFESYGNETAHVAKRPKTDGKADQAEVNLDAENISIEGLPA